jgi:hypothetical protein
MGDRQAGGNSSRQQFVVKLHGKNFLGVSVSLVGVDFKPDA